MYGEPLQPNRCQFEISIFDGIITLAVEDLDDPSNDDVREVVHPDFEKYWDNSMENVFETTHFKSMQEAKDWCISIGMVFDKISDDSEIKDETKVFSKFEKYSLNELKEKLNMAVRTERFEDAEEINFEIKKRSL